MKPPSKATLRRYGLTELEWLAMVPADKACFICERPPRNGKFVTDHEHVRGWAKRKPAERKAFVRGLICNFCNFRLLRKGLTLARAKRIVAYLERYATKRSGMC